MKVTWINAKDFEREMELVGWLASASSDTKEPSKYINIAKHCIKSGHLYSTRSMRFMFEIEGISRVVSHEFVRHEMGVIKCQESQRYVNAGDAEFVIPEDILDKDTDAFEMSILESFANYQDLLDAGYKKEIARYALTNATCTKINVCFNWEGLTNFFAKRLCRRAQPEMQELAQRVYTEIFTKMPQEFYDFIMPNFGPKCDIVGFCTEVQCCGKRPTKEKFMATYERGRFIEDGK